MRKQGSSAALWERRGRRRGEEKAIACSPTAGPTAPGTERGSPVCPPAHAHCAPPCRAALPSKSQLLRSSLSMSRNSHYTKIF